MASQTTIFRPRVGDAHLWAYALVISLLLNLALLACFGFATLQSEILRKSSRPAQPEAPRTIATIIAMLPEPTAQPTVLPPEPPKQFARTSEDQTASTPENPSFLGERNTRATSDRPPDSTAPPLPSQSGEEAPPETTENDYQDGKLAAAPAKAASSSSPSSSSPPPSLTTPAPAPVSPPPNPVTAATTAPAAARPASFQGPNPVDVAVPRKTDDSPKPTPPPEKPAPKPVAESPPTPPEKPEPKVAATPPSPDPAFSGNQRKSAIVGSISRTGRSALDVADSPLGRYEAAVSRAVEQEWQRNCVRHRDFITPGFLTVRFFVEPTGKVRSVSFDGDMQTGEIQKGFTLNSIRDAEIPPMPPTLRKDYAKSPLELVFRFYF